MRDFHSLSSRDQLYRLAEIAHEPCAQSHRQRRAAVALIFRITQRATPVNSPISPLSAPLSLTIATKTGYNRYLNPTPSYSSVIASLHALASQQWCRTNTELQLLFIQRARNPADRWSGQVGFPGGRKTKSENDYNCCIREVYEEIGLNLSDIHSFLYLGRLSDRDLDSFGNVKPLTVCPFIFIQIVRDTPRLTVDKKEINSVIFSPLSLFTSPALSLTFLVHPLLIYYSSQWTGNRRLEVGYQVRRKSAATVAFVKSNMSPSLSQPSPAQSPSASMQWRYLQWPRFLPSLYSFSFTHFPAVALSGHFLTADGRTGVAVGDKLVYDSHTPPSSQHSPSQSQPSSEPSLSANEFHDSSFSHGVDVDDSAFILWSVASPAIPRFRNDVIVAY